MNVGNPFARHYADAKIKPLTEYRYLLTFQDGGSTTPRVLFSDELRVDETVKAVSVYDNLYKRWVKNRYGSLKAEAPRIILASHAA